MKPSGFFLFYSRCQELHKPLNYVRTGGRTKVPWACLSLLPFCLVCIRKQMNFVSLGVWGSLQERMVHKYENICSKSLKKKKKKCSAVLQEARLLCCFGVSTTLYCRNFEKRSISSFEWPHSLKKNGNISLLDPKVRCKTCDLSRLEIESIWNSYNFYSLETGSISNQSLWKIKHAYFKKGFCDDPSRHL